MKQEKENRAFVWIWLLLALLSLIMLYGCKTTKYIPVNQVKTEKEYIDRYIRDSIYIHDREETEHKGDTVYRTLEKKIYRNVYKQDTAYIYVCDTVPVVTEVEVTREVVPTWSWWTLAVSLLAMGGVVWRIIRTMKGV